MNEDSTCWATKSEREGLVEAYVAGRLPMAEAASFEAHYLTCDRCQRELRFGLAIRAALGEDSSNEPAVSGASPGSSDLPNRSRFRWAGAAALAAAAVLGGLLLAGPGDVLETPVSEHRQLERAPLVAPEPLEPVQEIGGVDAFLWRSVPDADLYRFTLYRADGELVHEAETTDTVLDAWGDMRLQAGEIYLWKVEARVGWDRWIESGLAPFSVVEPGARTEP